MRAWIGGRPVDQREAVIAAGRILGAARSPIVGGLAGDVDAIRAAYRLALRIGASLDVDGSDALYADLSVLASRGAMTTTWPEAKARADLLLVVGRQPSRSPLLADLLDRPPVRSGVSARRVVSIGAPINSTSEHHVAVDAARIPATLGLLRAIIADRLPLTGEGAALAGAIDLIRQAKFGVAVYDPGELDELAIDMLQGLVKDLNDKNRFSSLSSGVAGTARAALAVGSWMTGDAPRIGLGRGYPEHDPWRFDATRLLASGEADAALWVGALHPASNPNVATTALLGHADGSEAGIVIEVAIPGQTRSGVIFDERRGTLVYVEAVQPGPEATAAEVVDAIRGAIDEKGTAPC